MLIQTMFEALPLLVDVFLLLMWVFFVFGIVGLTLFMGKMHKRCFDKVYEDLPELTDMAFNGTLFDGRGFNGTFSANDTSFLGTLDDGNAFQGGLVDVASALFNGTLQDGTLFQGAWFPDLSFFNGTWGGNATDFNGTYYAEAMGGDNSTSFDPTGSPLPSDEPSAAPALSLRLRHLLKGGGGSGDGGGSDALGSGTGNFTLVLASGLENTPCATGPPGPFRCPSRELRAVVWLWPLWLGRTACLSGILGSSSCLAIQANWVEALYGKKTR